MNKNKPVSKPGLLMTANWDSNVGYAWWLMESFWIVLAEQYGKQFAPLLAYPSISKIPSAIAQSEINVSICDFSRFDLSVLFAQLRYLHRHKVKVIYLSDKPSWHWIYFLYRVVGVKRIVVHDHTPGLRKIPSGLKKIAKRIINSLPLVTADACIGATRFLQKRYVEVACVSAKKCFVAPNGIPLRHVDPANIHDAFSVPAERSVIVTAARAHHYKGVKFALEALATLAKERPDLDWHYIFMGDGPHLHDFIAIAAQLDISDRVSFPGRVDGVLGYFASACFAFHPSSGEVGYSLSILEYMWAGLPVVVPDNPSVCGATKENKTGLIYAEANVEAAVAALAQLLDNPEATQQMGLTAKRCVEEEFSIAVTHHQLIQIFDKVMQGVS